MVDKQFKETKDHVVFSGVTFVRRDNVLTERIKRSMSLGRYEIAELRTIARSLTAEDRVLDIGGGIGFVSTKIAQMGLAEEILSVEANPALIDIIRETFELNGVADKTDCLHGAFLKADDGDTVDFYVRKNFWASSLAGNEKWFVEVIQVPVLNLEEVIDQFRPTVIVCDIEGGELDLIRDHDLSSVSRIILEVHPGVYGKRGLADVFEALGKQGFVLDTKIPRDGDVLSFERIDS